jgi:flagellar hook-associated protein 2
MDGQVVRPTVSMTRIQSSTGLITGIPIQDTVDKLMAVASQPKITLTNRTKLLESQKLAVTQLTSLLVAFQFETQQIGAESLFDSRQATTNNAALSASVSATSAPAVGSYLFTPVQTASAQQLLSQSFAAVAPARFRSARAALSMWGFRSMS